MTENSNRNSSPQFNIVTGEEVLSRRLVLKRAMTFSCGVVLPIVLMGCDSKQSDGSASSTAAPSRNTDRSSNSGASTSNTMKDSPATSSATADPGTNSSAAQSGTPGVGTEAPAANTSAGKVSQASVRYQDTPNANQNCIGCALFVEPNACSVVEGVIAPEGWCSIWAPKAA